MGGPEGIPTDNEPCFRAEMVQEVSKFSLCLGTPHLMDATAQQEDTKDGSENKMSKLQGKARVEHHLWVFQEFVSVPRVKTGMGEQLEGKTL